ncbi:MAG: nucleotidyltransferase substrate binding protein [Acidobacteria bacterium]|nr:nucleotidyltransferase substrate binding protein [Acidobacteriota bacterium]
MSKDSKTQVLLKAESLLTDLERAVQRLTSVLEQQENEFIRDAAIQRFEFCFELAWKGIQIIAKLEAQDCLSPRIAFSTAWHNRWISEEETWLDMLDARNRTSHTYRETLAEEVFADLPRFLPALRMLHSALVKRFQEIKSETTRAKPNSS